MSPKCSEEVIDENVEDTVQRKEPIKSLVINDEILDGIFSSKQELPEEYTITENLYQNLKTLNRELIDEEEEIWKGEGQAKEIDMIYMVEIILGVLMISTVLVQSYGTAANKFKRT